MSGAKHDKGKPPISLIPREAIEGMAKVFAFGAAKYERHNFRGGIAYSRLIDALLRHTIAYYEGEDLDPESGLSHVYHILCCAAMLSFMIEHKPELDDRWKP